MGVTVAFGPHPPLQPWAGGGAEHMAVEDSGWAWLGRGRREDPGGVRGVWEAVGGMGARWGCARGVGGRRGCAWVAARARSFDGGSVSNAAVEGTEAALSAILGSLRSSPCLAAPASSPRAASLTRRNWASLEGQGEGASLSWGIGPRYRWMPTVATQPSLVGR